MKPALVLDANAFIHLQDLTKLDTQYRLYSTAQAIAEVKDLNARERLKGAQISLKAPSTSATSFVRRFAKETGDLATLSDVDIDLLALAYTLLEENGKLDMIRAHPPKPIEFNHIKN
jgi:RNA-binding protein NOB1